MFRDFRYIIPFLVQFWLFATPPAYSRPPADASPWIKSLIAANPVNGLIASFRAAVFGEPIPWSLLRRQPCWSGDVSSALSIPPRGRQLRGHRLMNPAILVENIGKRYQLTHAGGGYRTLRETLVDMAAAPLRRLTGSAKTITEDFWALRDVSLQIQPGEVVGVIGSERCRKEHVSENPVADHRADHRTRRACTGASGACSRSARAFIPS